MFGLKLLFMNILTFTSSDNFEYIIPIINICYLSPDKQNGGTWIELSSGTRIHTKTDVKILTDKLKLS